MKYHCVSNHLSKESPGYFRLVSPLLIAGRTFGRLSPQWILQRQRRYPYVARQCPWFQSLNRLLLQNPFRPLCHGCFARRASPGKLSLHSNGLELCEFDDLESLDPGVLYVLCSLRDRSALIRSCSRCSDCWLGHPCWRFGICVVCVFGL